MSTQMKGIILLIFGLLTAIALIFWQFKFMINQHPNTDLLVELWKKMGPDERGGHQTVFIDH